jgi:hypothetical protein
VNKGRKPEPDEGPYPGDPLEIDPDSELSVSEGPRGSDFPLDKLCEYNLHCPECGGPLCPSHERDGLHFLRCDGGCEREFCWESDVL